MNNKVFFIKTVSMNDVEHVCEGVFRFLRDKCEFLQERVLSDCVRLSDNQIVTVWIPVESMLQEVL